MFNWRTILENCENVRDGDGSHGKMSYIVVLEVGAKDTPAKFADIGNDKARSEVCPCNETLRLGIVDHSKG